MVDRIFSPDLLAALDRFINEQHPKLSRYDALKLAFQDWAIRHGYLDTPIVETDVFPAGRRTDVSRADRMKAGGMLNQLIAGGVDRDSKPPG
jgi:hypothetical protein